MTKLDKSYIILVTFFVVVLVMTNLVGMKFFQAPFTNLALTTGILTYPFTFIISDVVTEIYGKKKANFMVYLGFTLSIFMYLVTKMMIELPPHPYWYEANNVYGYKEMLDYQKAYQSTFNVTSILIFASMLAFLSGQLLDVYLFQKIRQLTGGKHLWLRNNGSTMISQLIDTLIVNSIVLYVGLHTPFLNGLEVMSSMYLYKLILCALSTPFTYILVFFLRRQSRKEALVSSNI